MTIKVFIVNAERLRVSTLHLTTNLKHLRVRMGFDIGVTFLSMIKFSMIYWIAIFQIVSVLYYFMLCKLAAFIVARLSNTSKRKTVFKYLKQK